ncbi:conjugal transfer protein [Mycolicibacterium sp. BiH015]|uniref:conjugal transfer protein n=1 Tax=Mycolicibacterium sp. BiH015 TaxID=3018808 RepID=UPI0022E69753|nr:conjugal transfer protein [Mycolicibacterium sp. BiH015]MDA2893388.1 conjugal transfer protein [Mycolicibacterium sp. BiH015]
MPISRTWAHRLHRGHTMARQIGTLAVCLAATLGGAAAIKVFIVPDRPDIVAIAQRVGNTGDQVGAFAADFIVSWLTATAEHADQLQRFITLPENGIALPTTPAAVVTAPQVVSVIHTGGTAEADLYAATVSVTERAYASAEPIRSFYRVPIAMWNYQPRALTMPARINGPGEGADFTVAYRHTVSAHHPVHGLVSGFATAYLTAGTPLDRYVRAGSGLTPVGGYQSAVPASISADRPVPDTAEPGVQLHVLATVLAQTSQFATATLVYPLTVENTGGTWMITGIDLTPQIGEDREPAPIAPPHN